MDKTRVLRMTLAAGLLAARAWGQGLQIEHASASCAVSEAHPRLEARLTPAEAGARVRIYFRAAGGPHWYWVEMTPATGLWSGVLPRPLKTLPGFDYYIEATGSAFATARTPQVAVRVAPVCEEMGAAAMAASVPAIVVGAAPGASPLPAGFSAGGLVASAGGGVPALALVGAATVAGGAAAVVLAGAGCEEGQIAAGPARLTPAVFDCPRGSNPSGPYPVTLTVELRNDSAAAVELRSLTLAYRCAAKFPDVIPCPDQDLGPQPFAPDRVAAGARATITVDSSRTCTNLGTGPTQPVFVELEAVLSLATSCGSLAVSAGTHRVNAP